MLNQASQASSVGSSVSSSLLIAIRVVIVSAAALFCFLVHASCSAEVSHHLSTIVERSAIGMDLGPTFPPSYWRSYWFGAVCLVLGLSALSYLLLATLRLDQARAQHRLLRASEEREDTAYETSDGLLQGLQAIVWSIETASVRAEGIEPVRELLSHSLRQSGALMEEGRGRMMSLRRPTHREHLPNAIAVAGKELQRDWQRKYRVIVHGEMRDLRPMVRDDVYKIGREALNNAFRHAAASEIEAEFIYEDSQMRVYVRDDGCGIDSAALSDRSHGVHRGILDMHRKARKAGAILEIRSRRNAGTELELRIPASLAYEVDGSRPTCEDTARLI
jgi:signal transduction histidine kinase